MKPLLTALAVLALSPLAMAADLTGTVIESMDSGGYTYLHIKTAAGEKKWAAVTKTKIQKGAKATVVNTMDMMNFEARSLYRYRMVTPLLRKSSRVPGVVQAVLTNLPFCSSFAP